MASRLLIRWPVLAARAAAVPAPASCSDDINITSLIIAMFGANKKERI
jgi:hypothetical protein